MNFAGSITSPIKSKGLESMDARLILRGHGIISLNSSHYGHNFRKTKEVQQEIYRIKTQLMGQKATIRSITDRYVEATDFLRVTYTWVVPERLYFTKKGGMNKRLGDWSNFPKIYDDVVFNDVLGVDDSQVKRGVVNIIPWPKEAEAIVIDISIGQRDSLVNAWKKILPECLK